MKLIVLISLLTILPLNARSAEVSQKTTLIRTPTATTTVLQPTNLNKPCKFSAEANREVCLTGNRANLKFIMTGVKNPPEPYGPWGAISCNLDINNLSLYDHDSLNPYVKVRTYGVVNNCKIDFTKFEKYIVTLDSTEEQNFCSQNSCDVRYYEDNVDDPSHHVVIFFSGTYIPNPDWVNFEHSPL